MCLQARRVPGLLERVGANTISLVIGSHMTKTFIVAALLSSFAAVSFAQASAPEAASAPAKHAKHAKAHKMKKAASAATNPEASPDKKGGN